MGTEQNKRDIKVLKELLGAKAELNFSNGLYKGAYASRLEDISEPGSASETLQIGAAHPMFKGALLPLSRNLELLLRIETSACFYQAEAEIIRSVVNIPIPLVWLKLLSPLEKVQRRAFVRVPCRIKANACLLELESESEVENEEDFSSLQKKWFPLLLRDISLGGVGVAVRQEEAPMCQVGGRYLLQMTIDATKFFIVCRLVKVFQKNDDGSIKAGLAYEGLPSFTEKLMGGFIRQQELNLRGS